VALRNDVSAQGETDIILDETALGIGRRRIYVRHLGHALDEFRPDMVIVEQAIKNVETYRLLARSRFGGGSRVAMWGQGRSYSVPQSKAEAGFKLWLTRRSDWFFAYTQLGAAHVIDRGFDQGRVTVLRNTIDSESLAADLREVTPDDVEGVRSTLGLRHGRTAIFIGGVDEHKGIGFLLAAAVELERKVPGFRLLVGGAGSQEGLVRELEAAGGPVRYLGRLEGRSKAVALSVADLMLIPEWVGLVAIDSLVAGRPIVTTDYWSHSPELEYLVHESNCLIAPHDVGRYVDAVAKLFREPDRLVALQLQARSDSVDYGMAGMVDRFAQGIMAWSESRV
jgi:glycosyltransferase involved in cell wall biosynthesis